MGVSVLCITKNTDSFRFGFRRFRNLDTGKTWWLLNLRWWTITWE